MTAPFWQGHDVTVYLGVAEGFRCVLVEKDKHSAGLIRRRLSKPIQPVMFGGDT